MSICCINDAKTYFWTILIQSTVNHLLLATILTWYLPQWLRILFNVLSKIGHLETIITRRYKIKKIYYESWNFLLFFIIYMLICLSTAKNHSVLSVKSILQNIIWQWQNWITCQAAKCILTDFCCCKEQIFNNLRGYCTTF